jgi:hypothetical protein
LCLCTFVVVAATNVSLFWQELEDVVSQQENILELVCEASRFVKDHGKVVDLSYYDRKKANALEVGLEQKKVSVLMDLVEAEYERDRYATMVTFSKINSVLDLGVEGLD